MANLLSVGHGQPTDRVRLSQQAKDFLWYLHKSKEPKCLRDYVDDTPTLSSSNPVFNEMGIRTIWSNVIHSSLQRTALRLFRQGLVKRCKGYLRWYYYSLTPKGESVVWAKILKLKR